MNKAENRKDYYRKPDLMLEETIPKIDYVEKLPILPKLGQIIQTIKKSMVTIVRNESNVGSLVGISYFLSMEKCFNKIACCLPSDASTKYAINMLSKISNKLCIGQMQSFISKISQHNIICGSSEHFVKKWINSDNRTSDRKYIDLNLDGAKIDVLLLDEFHLRNKWTDICFCLWTHWYQIWKNNPTVPKPPKLVLITYGDIDDILPLIPNIPSILSYTLSPTNQNIVYDERSDKWAEYNDSRYLHSANLAITYYKKNYPGNYLILLPGKNELNMVYTALNKLSKNQICIKSTDEELMFNSPKKCIYLSINHAPFLPNITLVIDTMTYRQSIKKDETLTNDLIWIHKQWSEIRKKCTDNIYLIMMSKKKYESLPISADPEINQICISKEILAVMQRGIDPKLFAILASPDTINKQIDMLKNIGLISKTPDNVLNYHMAQFCVDFPLTIRKNVMVYHLWQQSEPSTFLHLAVICSISCYGSGLFYWPKKKNEDISNYSMRKDELIQKIEDNFIGYSDIDTIFNIWTEICRSINPFYLTDLYIFCKYHMLNFKHFQNAVDLLKICLFSHNRLSTHHNLNILKSNLSKINFKNLGKTFYSLLSLTHYHYETKIVHKANGKMIGSCQEEPYQIDDYSIHQMELGNNDNKIYYALVKSHINDKKNIIPIINILHAIPDGDADDNFSIFSSDLDSVDDSI